MITRTKKSILRGEHPQLSHFFTGTSANRILGYVGPMASGKTFELISHLKIFDSFLEQNSPEEETIILGIKNGIDNRLLNTSGSYVESRLWQYKAIVTNTPYDWLAGNFDEKKVYFLGVSDVQFFSYDQIKKLIAFTKDNNNIFLIIEALNFNFRGEPFPHSDFGGTVFDTLALIPRQNVKKLTAACNSCGKDGAEYTVRSWVNGDGELEPVPIYDKLIRVGGDSIESNSNGKMDPIIGVKDPKINYGACHEDEFRKIQDASKYTEWSAVYNSFKLSGDQGNFQIGFVRDFFKKLRMSEEIFYQIVSRFLEEKVITICGLEERINNQNSFSERELENMMGENARWIKKY